MACVAFSVFNAGLAENLHLLVTVFTIYVKSFLKLESGVFFYKWIMAFTAFLGGVPGRPDIFSFFIFMMAFPA